MSSLLYLNVPTFNNSNKLWEANQYKPQGSLSVIQCLQPIG
jgi:hypothetical protein